MSLVGFKAQNHKQQVSKNGANGKVDDRETPACLFDPLHERHDFTIDVAASPCNAKVARYYTLEDDGLAQSWAGERVWVNPPYSEIRPWVEKAWSSMRDGAELVVMLLPANRTEQRWWQDLVEPYRDGRSTDPMISLTVEFRAGRLRFDVPGGYNDPRGNRPPFGVALLTFSRKK